MRGVQLGPNHKDYGKPIQTLPASKPKSEHAPRPGRPPKAMLVTPIAETEATPRARYTPPQLLKAYAAEHDLIFGRECPCSLCDDLRWLLDSARAQREVERNGR